MAETQPVNQQDSSVFGGILQCRDGTRRLYRTRAEGFSDVRGFLEEFWDARLQTLKVEVEREQGGRDGG
ncbi:MAG: hypothetical protein ACRDZO_26510 [Egibacteraceae bacterium]